MSSVQRSRRETIASALAAVPAYGLNWDDLPVRKGKSEGFDVIVIGAGLGGLSCAAACVRQGFKPLVIEKHNKPGGYATAFRRPGGFVFDASLHSTVVGERNGVRNLILGCPEITGIEFVPHRSLYRAIYPDHDVRAPFRDVPGYIRTLVQSFPKEEAGIRALIDDMRGVASDIAKYSTGSVNAMRVPVELPHLYRSTGMTWGQMLAARVKDPRLQSILSALWSYYGLPPSRLASFYYALPTYQYLSQGGYYPKGRSQKISDALAAFIAARGGQVLLNTRVDKVLVKDGAACGVVAGGREYKARAVASNANPYDLFHSLVEGGAEHKDYLARMDRMTPSLSSFQVFLGLKRDLAGELKIGDTEIFVHPGYDSEEMYAAALAGDPQKTAIGLTLYDNLYPGYSPKGKNTLSLIALYGFEPWKKFEADYRAGNKAAYHAEKERIAGLYLQRAEKILPGLARAIEVKVIGTPLTNWRYTGNYHGAIYGWDQTLDNSGIRRLGYDTPVKNLYLAGAWTRPGGGYTAVLESGLDCFARLAKTLL